MSSTLTFSESMTQLRNDSREAGRLMSELAGVEVRSADAADNAQHYAFTLFCCHGRDRHDVANDACGEPCTEDQIVDGVACPADAFCDSCCRWVLPCHLTQAPQPEADTLHCCECRWEPEWMTDPRCEVCRDAVNGEIEK